MTHPNELGIECGRFSYNTGVRCVNPFVSEPARREWEQGYRGSFNQEEFRNELLLVANGLDCAGSHEASYLENWAEDLKGGTPWHAVWAQMQARYADGNSDFLERFEPHINKLRQ